VALFGVAPDVLARARPGFVSTLTASGDVLRFEGQAAIITGGAGGLGRAYALVLAARGAQVVVNDVARTAAASVAEEIERAGGAAIADDSDISRLDGSAQVVDRALDTFGRLDIVVNNAGIYQIAPFETLEPDEIERMLQVNVAGPIHVTRAAWPHLLARGYGRVVMTGSSVGLFGFPDRAHYAASKAAMVGLTRGLSAEGRARGVNVNAVLPSAFTPMANSAAHLARIASLLDLDPSQREEIASRSTELVAPLVAWLAHEACPVSGEIFETSAGRVTRILFASGPELTDRGLTLETLRDRFDDLMNESGLSVRPPIWPQPTG
jgi:NAD(P)-dependent dehydrogenase (short-subunit alcohol dehydrogenase family)